jgi:hypothetical protein
MQTIVRQAPSDVAANPSPIEAERRVMSNNTERQEDVWSGILDWIVPLLSIAVLLAACLLGSPKKELWIDEAYTLQVVTDPSLGHMMHALANAVDGGMPLYYLVARAWVAMFGASLLGLRLLSSIFVCAGVLVMGRILRRAYTAWAVSLAMVATTVTSSLLLHQNVEARYYGIYFACATLVVAAQLRLCTKHTPSRRLLVMAVAAHGALVMSHPFGVFYSGLAILALAFSDYRRTRLRWSLYLTLTSAWVLLLMWMGPILKIHDLALPRNWTPVPTITEVLQLFEFGSPCLVFGLLLGAGLAALAPKAEHERNLPDISSPLLYHGFAFLLLPLPIALISWGGSSLFVPRYFLPSLIGAAALIAFLLDAQVRTARMNFALRSAWCLLLAVILAWPLLSTEKTRDNRLAYIDSTVPPDLPVLVVDGNLFLPLSFISRRPARPYYYPLDWDAALHSAPGETLKYKLMRNAKASGYFSDRIMDSQQAACSFKNFVVLDDPQLAWFRDRIFNNPGYQVEHIGDFGADRQLWLVESLPSNSTCP